MATKGKSIIAFLYAVAVTAVPLLSGNHRPTPAEWIAIAIAAVTALSVYITPLIPQAAWTKTAIGATLAGLNILVTLVGADWHLSGSQILTVAFAVLAALGIQLAPAASANGVAVGTGSDHVTTR